jgi:regulator of protease activity HflC (stomatin/prohibitin superfamily)
MEISASEIVGIIGLSILGLVSLFALISSFVVTTQKEVKVIERFGKFVGIRRSGLSFKVPFIDRVAYTQSLRIDELNVNVETITQDKVSVHIKVAIQYYVKDNDESIQNAVYELSDFQQQIQSYVFNEVRAEVPKNNLDQVYENKMDIENAVKAQLSDAIEKYGYVIQNALVVDIAPDGGVKDAMNRINAAARDRKAAEEEGEALKIRKIKEAEAEAESKKLQGQGTADQRDAIIKGFEKSIEAFSKNTGIKQETVMRFVEITQYFDTMREMAKDNKNVIFMQHSPTGAGIVDSLISSEVASKVVNTPENDNSKKETENVG